MLFGRIGAGKTTLARQLETEGAVRLSLDEWTIAANGSQITADPQVDDRVRAQLTDFWPQLVAVGVDVVLDLAFWRRSQRDEVREIARRLGAEAELVWVVCDEEERRRRCLARSENDAGTYMIDAKGFDAIDKDRIIEEPESDEVHSIVETGHQLSVKTIRDVRGPHPP